MPSAISRFAKFAAIAALTSATVFASLGDAEARRAGSSGFGSRGTRTFQAPPVTQTAPAPAAPIERSMTPRPQTTAPATAQQPFGAQRPGLFGGFGRSMIGGLIAGGLLGMLLGHGFGGGFGFLGMLLQIALIGGAVMLAMRYFANRRQPSYGAGGQGGSFSRSYSMSPANNSSFQIPTIGSGSASSSRGNRPSDEIGLAQADLDQFEELLTDVQTAYGAEDYAALRRLTTPEAMSYLAEELGENASNGVRNRVSDVKLLQGDIAEAWREDGQEYATLAMRYSSIDAMVERDSGRVVSGDDRRPSESTEVWTFVRKPGADWKLAAIQGSEQRAA
ncbi:MULTISPECIES: Tim44 domain-containing protein [unclassified Rhizobium]|uniref:Tim44 domain-containing protein n=1 Tax=unclassified Rhizobium TaxID=2613769 RepID=UPI0007EBFE2A|nr:MULTISPECIES: Tim44 domain-containing protein [unclassified Rhizobium]ANM13478.1 inner membrane transporter Tim44-related protein [Rhizobium sp. N324]ANM19874.1 inner membrane transporter Tim44-related protein [Rhizobium sp. N541]ANM26259.1 inner membrane transporter Tim44-related protein [Rhizobium sp. N941]OYD01268.1 inner membrane transporter Tim44-related protein [Rhizobium sp. N4311]